MIMNKKLILAIFSIIGFSSIVSASGPGTLEIFDDLKKPNTEYEYVDNWYSEAAHFFKNINVIQGINGNFVANENVNRAQLAVILKRYDDYLTNPMGIEWEEYKNSHYSVNYPKNALFTLNNTVKMDECDSGLMGLGDNRLYVECSNSEEKSVEALLDSLMQIKASTSYQEFMLNGHKAWKVTQIDLGGEKGDNIEASEIVIVENEDKIYQLGYGKSLNDIGFENFYRSFKPL